MGYVHTYLGRSRYGTDLRPGPILVAGALVRVTLKLAPSVPSADGRASACADVLSIVIACPFACLMLRCRSFSTVVAPVKVTVPKLSKGSSTRRPADGDSSTHSAEEREDAYATLFW